MSETTTNRKTGNENVTTIAVEQSATTLRTTHCIHLVSSPVSRVRGIPDPLHDLHAAQQVGVDGGRTAADRDAVPLRPIREQALLAVRHGNNRERYLNKHARWNSVGLMSGIQTTHFRLLTN